MNKPPERLRVVYDDRDGWISLTKTDVNQFANAKEHFYTLEKPMTQKTENLTTEAAWAAMARGECVKSGSDCARRIIGNGIEYYDPDSSTWNGCSTIGMYPYSIVPDPSKPKEVKEIGNDYTKSREKIILQEACHDDIANMILHHMDRFFVRKP